ncbi:hypothetical protein F5B20DRAFT_592718 [Whalleya microplaca]|nr:hypothetical protein F5B20DRAFT_592718 [Whalleya microplaca]
MLLILPLVSLCWISITIARNVSVRRANAGCGFRLSTEGGFNGVVGQLAGGQVRAGSDLSPSLLTWFGDAFVDQQGRGCWWTPPSTCLQCDMYQQPDHGFGIGCDGGISFNSQTTFYECQTGDGDQVNIYLKPSGANCSTITLVADSCRPPCGGTSSPPPPGSAITPSPTPTSPAPSSQPATTTPPTSSTTTTPTTSPAPTSPKPGECTVVVAQGPSEIILIDRGNPDASYGANAAMAVQVTPNATSLFNFNLAAADSGKKCALVFRLPPPNANPTPYNLTGSGVVSFALLSGPGNAGTTWNSAPGVAMPLEAAALVPGVEFRVLEFPCPGANAPVAFAMMEPSGGDTCLEFLQDGGGGEVMGLYLVKC